MFNLADILAQAAGKQGFDQIAGQFGMAPDQVRTAMEALLPAFSLGLNRATQSPAGMADLFSLFAGGPNYAQMYENPMAAGPQMMAAGQQALTHIFGSPELTQAVARQTALATGMGQDLMKQVMPLMASLLMGGLVKGAAGDQNPLAEMVTAMIARMMPQQAAADPAGMMGMFANFFGPASAGKPAQASGLPGLDQLMELGRRMQAANPLLAASMKTGGAETEASGPRTLGQQAADTWTATMGRMFEAGRDIQDQQLAQLENLFAEFGRKPPSDGEPT